MFRKSVRNAFSSIRRVWRLILKELLITIGIPEMCAVLIVPPLMQLVMFAYAVSLEVINVRVGVCNMDFGVESSTFLKTLTAKPVFCETVFYHSYDELKDAIEKRDIFVAIAIPQDFSQKYLSPNETADLQLLVDGRRANASAIVSGYISYIVQTYGIQATVQNTDMKLASTNDVVIRRWFNPNLLARNSFLPGLICLLTTTVGIMVSALSISREREMGTFEQLLVSPASPFEIVIGKAIASVILATCSVFLITGVTIYWFKLPLLGSFWILLAASTLYLTSIVSVGLVISAVSSTQQQSTLGVFLFMPTAVMLSGFATPIQNMPLWLRVITIPNPVRWEMEVMKSLFLKGTSTEVIVLRLIPLALVAAFSLIFACYMFNRRKE